MTIEELKTEVLRVLPSAKWTSRCWYGRGGPSCIVLVGEREVAIDYRKSKGWDVAERFEHETTLDLAWRAFEASALRELERAQERYAHAVYARTPQKSEVTR